MAKEHPLKKWLTANRMMQKDFAKSIGFTDSKLSRVLSGHHGITPQEAYKIMLATDGVVDFMAWVDEDG